MVFSFGQSEWERLEVDAQRYERTLVGEYFDDNWLNIKIKIRAGGFHGKAEATIQTSELVKFLSELRPLYELLNGWAEFSTLEEQLSLRFQGDGKGHIELKGEVRDQPGIGNCLRFTLQLDQSQLAVSIRELEAVISTFPIRSA